mmetsp:Transcript_29889/g.62896  ORF Transcript_29889/g.62896 Transcript_29889/m.62896 type:complete len:269 (-) Transcript_29889:147-953(-)
MNDTVKGGQSGSVREETRPAGFREWAMRIGAVGNFGVQCVNMALASTRGSFSTMTTTKQVGTGMVYASSGLGAVHSPIVIYKERQLTKEDTFRTALNGIREQQNRLAEQNDVLSAEIDDLQSEVDRMKDIELALRNLAEVQGSQLDELMNLIEENKEINRCMRSVLKNKALEEVVSLVLDIDNDGSFTIQNKEIDRLIIGMKLIEGISFDDHMFRSDILDCGGDVDKVILLIKEMINAPEGRSSETRCTISVDDPEDWFKRRKSQARY